MLALAAIAVMLALFWVASITLGGPTPAAPTATAMIIPDLIWIEIKIGVDAVSLFAGPTKSSDEIVQLRKGDLVTFMGRHENEGWYLTSWRGEPAWIHVGIPTLRQTLDELPLVSEEDAARTIQAGLETPEPRTSPAPELPSPPSR